MPHIAASGLSAMRTYTAKHLVMAISSQDLDCAKPLAERALVGEEPVGHEQQSAAGQECIESIPDERLGHGRGDAVATVKRGIGDDCPETPVPDALKSHTLQHAGSDDAVSF